MGDEGATPSTTHEDPTVGDDTSTTAPLDAGTDTTTQPDTDTETTTTPPDTDTETDSGAQPPGCECIPDEELRVGVTPSAPTCGETLCPTVSATCAADCPPETFEVADLDALECTLLALRERTPGVVTWAYDEDTKYRNVEDGYVLVREDGTVVRRSWSQVDVGCSVSDAVLGELPPPESFDACIAETDVQARFDCVRALLPVELAVCNEGADFDGCI